MIGTQILQRYVVDYGPWMLSWLIIFNAICSLLRILDTHKLQHLFLWGVIWQRHSGRKATATTKKSTVQTARIAKESDWRQRGKLSRPGGNLEPKAVGTQTRIWIMNQMTKWAGYPMSMEILRGGSVDLCWIFHISWRIPYSKSKKIETMSE